MPFLGCWLKPQKRLLPLGSSSHFHGSVLSKALLPPDLNMEADEEHTHWHVVTMSEHDPLTLVMKIQPAPFIPAFSINLGQ